MKKSFLEWSAQRSYYTSDMVWAYLLLCITLGLFIRLFFLPAIIFFLLMVMRETKRAPRGNW